MQALIDLFDIKDLIPHGYCLSWSPILLWLHVVSDLLITLSYYAIPPILLYFIRQRKDFPYPRLVALFAGFIVACGTTHLLSAITVWIPLYWLDGLLKGFTAILSVAAAALTLWVVLRVLSLPSTAQLQAEIQQRKTAEEALRVAIAELQKNSARTQLLLGSALDGIISMDHNGKVIGWNAQAEHIFGYSSEQAIGCELADLIIPPAYRERHRQGLSRFMVTGTSNIIIGARLEIIGLRADASEVPVELAVDALGHEDGYFFNAYIRDITERKQMEAKLRDSENRLNTILDSVEAYIYIKDCNYQYQYANKPVRQLFGQELEDIIGKTDSDFFNESTAATLRENDRHIIELGQRIATEEINIDKINTVANTYLSVKQPLRREDGSIYGLCGISTDISERKQMENALRESEFRWKFAVEGSGDGLWDWNVAEGTVFFSRRWKEMLGFTKDEIGNGLDEWKKRIHPDDKTDTLAVVQAHFDDETPVYTSEHRVSCKDGSWKWILDRGIVVSRDAEGNPLRVIGTHTDISERKQMEEKLRDSDAFNISILNSLASQIAVLDAQGVIVAVNNAWRQFAKENHLSESSQNFLGFNYLDACENPFDLPYGDEANAAQDGIAAVLAGYQETFHLEYPCHSPTQQRWFHMNVSPLQGSRRGVVVSHQDITERKLMEDELKASEVKFRSIIEASPVPMAMNNDQLNITFLNPAFVQTFGYSMDDIPTLADWWPKAYPDLDYRQWVVETWQAELGQSEREHQPFQPMELNICSKDGALKTVLGSAALISESFKDEHLVVLYDITERKQAELAKRNSEEQLRAFYELDLVGLAVTSLEKGWVRINECLCRMLEYSEQDLHEMTWAELTHPEDLASDTEQFEKLLAHEINGYALEKRFISRTGKIIPAKLVVRGVRKTGGELDYVMAMVEDITEYKRAESELKRSNADLEQFAYAISHDMRQPLRMVTSYLSLIESALTGQLNEETQQFIDFAANGAKRMDAMILSLLDYSRVGRKYEAKTRICSKASLDEALAFLGPELNACGGEIKATGAWPELFASRDELTRLLQNLIGNALKYHEENQPPQVDVHGRVSGELFRVEVRDHGIGIEPSQMDRLFKVFSRLQARSRFDGTGVGLALCRKIVEHHNGTIGVESAGEGQGCMFWFELPVLNNANLE
ncbi:MAG: PAS domain S-box protein [Methylobacter sp.]|uniref:PAS domain S-box protein n=1 Tax=Methylobacter sp. TaxID=2051955 RepID=UPI0027303F6D|nr:PAS domain S-box protein [Methylobacter sp.]MDP1667264.1 PAS domain S-box protein [Methylobacter sp.]